MGKDKITLSFNSKEFNRQIEKALRANPSETVKAVKECALHLCSQSVKQAPIESGDLRNNCHADLNGVGIFENKSATNGAILSTTKVKASVGYSLPYALRQHEELDYRHDRTDGHKRDDGTTINMVAGGKAKFLEDPYNENEAKFIARMEDIIARSIK